MTQRTEIEAEALVAKAGMSTFVPIQSAFAYSGIDGHQVHVVSHEAIEIFVRGAGVANIVDDRAFEILDAIRIGDPLPPIEVHASEPAQLAICYKLYDGFHRYHLSRSLGFTHIPVIVVPRPF